MLALRDKAMDAAWLERNQLRKESSQAKMRAAERQGTVRTGVWTRTSSPHHITSHHVIAAKPRDLQPLSKIFDAEDVTAADLDALQALSRQVAVTEGFDSASVVEGEEVDDSDQLSVQMDQYANIVYV